MMKFLNPTANPPVAIYPRSTRFTVIVRTLDDWISYEAFGIDSATVHMAAVAIFGACGVTVKPICVTAA